MAGFKFGGCAVVLPVTAVFALIVVVALSLTYSAGMAGLIALAARTLAQPSFLLVLAAAATCMIALVLGVTRNDLR